MTLQQYIDHIHRCFMLGKATAPRMPKFSPETITRLSQDLGLAYVPEKESGGNVCMADSEEVRPEYRLAFSAIDLLDYAYAVLHSLAYRTKHQESQKVDFPQIPSPQDAAVFWKLVELGGELRRLHLLESPLVKNLIPQYPVDGDNEVNEPRFVPHVIVRRNDDVIPQSGTGRVYINQTQYFDRVPASAWSLRLGDYQPAKKWLKDRVGNKVELKEILHYQKIIVAITETERLMKEIDGVGK